MKVLLVYISVNEFQTRFLLIDVFICWIIHIDLAWLKYQKNPSWNKKPSVIS